MYGCDLSQATPSSRSFNSTGPYSCLTIVLASRLLLAAALRLSTWKITMPLSASNWWYMARTFRPNAFTTVGADGPE